MVYDAICKAILAWNFADRTMQLWKVKCSTNLPYNYKFKVDNIKKNTDLKKRWMDGRKNLNIQKKKHFYKEISTKNQSKRNFWVRSSEFLLKIRKKSEWMNLMKSEWMAGLEILI